MKNYEVRMFRWIEVLEEAWVPIEAHDKKEAHRKASMMLHTGEFPEHFDWHEEIHFPEDTDVHIDYDSDGTPKIRETSPC